MVEPIPAYWQFSIYLSVFFQIFFYNFFQCLKSINISSKHTKHSCIMFYIPFYIPLSVLDTKVKHFKAFFFHRKSRFPWASLANPSCFLCVFHSLWIFLLSTNSASFCFFYFMAFHSSGVSLLTGQLFLPVSLVMLSIATLEGFISNLGAFWRCKVYTSWRKKRKSSFPPCFLYCLWAANAHCHNHPQKELFVHLFDFLKCIQGV